MTFVVPNACVLPKLAVLLLSVSAAEAIEGRSSLALAAHRFSVVQRCSVAWAAPAQQGHVAH